MYTTLLSLHSIFRWLVFLNLICLTCRAYYGWLFAREATPFDAIFIRSAAIIFRVQLLIGIWLYLISPLVRYFLDAMAEAVKDDVLRFYGLAHGILAMTSFIIATVGISKAKRRDTDIQKFRTLAIWSTAALLIVFISIPWPFSPLSARPYFRAF